MTSSARLVLFTRYPEAGRAKTRLIPAIGAERAAALHRRLTERSVATMRASGLAIEIRSTGAGVAAFADWLGADLAIVDQGEGDLGDRLSRASREGATILLGADTPDLAAAHLQAAAAALDAGHAVIGPAEDGGYWLLGVPKPMPALFAAMPWSTDRVAAITIERLSAEGFFPERLETLSDLDRPEDLSRWPDLAA